MSRAAAKFTEIVREAHPWDRLPFVAPKGDKGRRDFWAPRSTGNFAFDFTSGREYAEAALPMLRADEDRGILLRWIVLAMVDHTDRVKDLGVIAGMMGAVGCELRSERPVPLFEHTSSTQGGSARA